MAGEAITWIDTSSVSHALDGTSNYLATIGEQSNYMAPIANLDQRTPLQPGTNVRYVDVQPRILTYPILVTATTETLLRTAIRQLTQMFNTSTGPGILRATNPDGTTTRDISCYYYGGLEGDGSYPNRTPGSMLFPLQLLAYDPLWHDTTPTSTLFTNAQLASAISITNNGDFECWPVWAITGPFVNLTMTNTTTSKAIKLTANGGINFLVANTLTIDLSPGKKSFLKQDLTNQVSFLTTDSLLWSLAPGVNSITFTMTGNTSATTATVTYAQRYWSC
jgi:hypothetical protein